MINYFNYIRNSVFGRQWQVNLFKFKANLVYIASSPSQQELHKRAPVSKKKKNVIIYTGGFLFMFH